jgi:hypothetical protein
LTHAVNDISYTFMNLKFNSMTAMSDLTNNQTINTLYANRRMTQSFYCGPGVAGLMNGLNRTVVKFSSTERTYVPLFVGTNVGDWTPFAGAAWPAVSIAPAAAGTHANVFAAYTRMWSDLRTKGISSGYFNHTLINGNNYWTSIDRTDNQMPAQQYRNGTAASDKRIGYTASGNWTEDMTILSLLQSKTWTQWPIAQFYDGPKTYLGLPGAGPWARNLYMHIGEGHAYPSSSAHFDVWKSQVGSGVRNFAALFAPVNGRYPIGDLRPIPQAPPAGGNQSSNARQNRALLPPMDLGNVVTGWKKRILAERIVSSGITLNGMMDYYAAAL